MADAVTKQESTLIIMNESTPRSIEAIRAQHQGRWLFIETTAVDEVGDAIEGRLIAIADHEIDLTNLRYDAAQRNLPVAVLHANYDEPSMELTGYATKLVLVQTQ